MTLIWLVLFWPDVPKVEIRQAHVRATYTFKRTYVKIEGEPVRVIRFLDNYFDKCYGNWRKVDYLRSAYDYYRRRIEDDGNVILYCGGFEEKLIVWECLNGCP